MLKKVESRRDIPAIGSCGPKLFEATSIIPITIAVIGWDPVAVIGWSPVIVASIIGATAIKIVLAVVIAATLVGYGGPDRAECQAHKCETSGIVMADLPPSHTAAGAEIGGFAHDGRRGADILRS
jgi:hypothetical protein